MDPRQRYESVLKVAPDDAGFDVRVLVNLSRLAVPAQHQRNRAKWYHRQVVNLHAHAALPQSISAT